MIESEDRVEGENEVLGAREEGTEEKVDKKESGIAYTERNPEEKIPFIERLIKLISGW